MKYMVLLFLLAVSLDQTVLGTAIDLSQVAQAKEAAGKAPIDETYLPPLDRRQREELLRWRELAETGDFGEIVKRSHDAPAAVRAHPRLSLELGLAYLQLAAFDSAEDEIRQTLSIVPDWQPALLALASVLHEQQRWQPMLPILARALTPANATAAQWRWYLAVAMQAGDSAVAAAVAQMAVLRFPSDLSLRELSAHAFLQAGDVTAALNVLRGLVSNQPKNATYWRLYAQAAQRADDVATYRVALRMAVFVEPSLESFDDAAQATAHQAAQQTRLSLMAALRDAGQVQPAFEQASVLMQQAAVTLSERLLAAQIAVEADKLEHAQRWLDSVVEEDVRGWVAQDSNSGSSLILAQFFQLRIHIALAEKRVPDAMRDFELLSTTSAMTPELWLWYGAIAEESGDVALAETVFRRVLATVATRDSGAEQTSLTAGLRLLTLLLKQGRQPEAQSLFRQLQQQAPGNATVAQFAAHIAP